HPRDPTNPRRQSLVAPVHIIPEKMNRAGGLSVILPSLPRWLRVTATALSMAGTISPTTHAQQQTRPRPPGAARPPVMSQRYAALETVDSSALAGVRWREVGPYRGGRSV